MHTLYRSGPARPGSAAAGARTVAVAQRAAELITDIPSVCELIEAILAGPRRVRFATAIALQAQPGSVDTVAVARRHITDAITEAALARADAEVAP